MMVVVVVAAALLSRPAAASADCPSAAAIPAGSGIIVGQVQRSGIDPRRGGSGAGPPAPVAGDPLTIVDASGTVVAQRVSEPDGTFMATVPAGHYTVTEDILGASQEVDVADQGTTTITLLLSQAG